MTKQDEPIARPWVTTETGRLIGRGHPAGDFLEAWSWELLEEGDGYLRVSAHLPNQVRNPRGQLFGGFTPTYVDLVALFTVRSRALRAERKSLGWLATTSMRVDYFNPIVGPKFIIDSRRETQRGRTHFVLTRFFQDTELAVLAATTMREVATDARSATRDPSRKLKTSSRQSNRIGRQASWRYLVAAS